MNFRTRIYESYRTAAVSAPNRKAQGEQLAVQIAQYHARWKRYLPQGHTLSALDLGCGGGEFLCFLSEIGFTDLCGIDISPQQVAIARGRGLSNVIEGDILAALNSDLRQYDVIATFNILEHLTRDELFILLDQIQQHLKPGGVLLAVVPNARGIFGAKVRWADITHELSFTPESIRQVFATTDLELVSIRENGPLVHGAISLARWLVWQAVRLCALLVVMAETGNYWDRCFTQDMLVVAQLPTA